MTSAAVCPNCDIAHREDDLFCENCGYDFITGSLPATGANDAPVPNSVANDQPPQQSQVTARIEVSPEYFAHAVEDSELTIPDPIPPGAEVTFTDTEIHIGRTSESRGIHPQIDLASITADPAVSSRHAVIRLAANGAVSVTDVGSTNGTVIGDPSGETIEPNVAYDLDPDTWIYLGAWTRLQMRIT